MSVKGDNCNSLLQASAARQSYCYAVRSNPTQSADCSQQLHTVHQHRTRSTAVQVSYDHPLTHCNPLHYIT